MPDATREERQPHGGGWERMAPPALDGRVLSVSRWRYGRILVISALEDAEYPDGNGRGPQWHLSVSRSGVRPSAADVRRAQRAFRMVGTEEDNHHPGNARHFWLPVDPAHRVTCQCKDDEDVIRETDGYTWTNPRPESGEGCRGCEFERLKGKPCPIHSASEGRTP